MQTPTWCPRGAEDKMLNAYWAQQGDLYIEVALGVMCSPWSGGSTTRRVDGVRIPTSARPTAYRFSDIDPTDFRRNVQAGHAELIEVKRSLNRGVIGQAIAARHMFESQYGVRPACLTVLCAHGDMALEWVCDREGIRVVILKQSTGVASGAGDLT